MQRKIREAQRAKVPFMGLAGEKDVAQHSVSFRYRDGSQRNFVPLDEAVRHVVDFIESRDNTEPSAQAPGEPAAQVTADPSG
ncbi:MAG TPA: His/Gly/Thr/Pro-type tRNA ligase C-terminal domain-containing protein, partial [Actinomycetota bacterium]